MTTPSPPKSPSHEEMETDCGGFQCRPCRHHRYCQVIVCEAVSWDCFSWCRLGEETNSDKPIAP